MVKLAFLKPGLVLLAVLVPAPLLGRWLAQVFRDERHILSFLYPLERLAYRIGRIDQDRDMGWKEYLHSLLLFNAAGILVLVGILMTQEWLPFNPQGLPNLPWHLALNAAISFATNTDWQSYSGESMMSYFSQAMGLVTWNFASAATGSTVAVALSRAFAVRREGKGLVGLVGLFERFGTAIALVSQGVPATLAPYAEGSSMKGAVIAIPLGPAASQIAIKQLGSDGGGYFGVNSAHPFENPTPLSNFLQMAAILLLPAAFLFLFGELVGRPRQGWSIFGAMLLILLAGAAVAVIAELSPATALGGLPAMEGKETRIGVTETATWAALTTAVANGSINGMHGSASPVLLLVAIANMAIGEERVNVVAINLEIERLYGK